MHLRYSFLYTVVCVVFFSFFTTTHVFADTGGGALVERGQQVVIHWNAGTGNCTGEFDPIYPNYPDISDGIFQAWNGKLFNGTGDSTSVPGLFDKPILGNAAGFISSPGVSQTYRFQCSHRDINGVVDITDFADLTITDCVGPSAWDGTSCASPAIKICASSCSSGSRRDGGNFTLEKGKSDILYACFGTGSCSLGDSGVSGNWTTNSASPYMDAVNIFPSLGFSSAVTGKTVGQEGINLTYNAATVSTEVNVICVETVTCSSEQSKVCSTKTVPAGTTLTRFCGGVMDCSGKPGTRYCDFNYREVAP